MKVPNNDDSIQSQKDAAAVKLQEVISSASKRENRNSELLEEIAMRLRNIEKLLQADLRKKR